MKQGGWRAPQQGGYGWDGTTLEDVFLWAFNRLVSSGWTLQDVRGTALDLYQGVDFILTDRFGRIHYVDLTINRDEKAAKRRIDWRLEAGKLKTTCILGREAIEAWLDGKCDLQYIVADGSNFWRRQVVAKAITCEEAADERDKGCGQADRRGLDRSYQLGQPRQTGREHSTCQGVVSQGRDRVGDSEHVDGTAGG